MIKRMLCVLMAIVLVPVCAFAQQATLDLGSSGEDVLRLQKRLISLGFSIGNADGIYGNKTAAAVSEAQRLLAAAGYETEQTGKADPDTLALIHDEQSRDALQTLRRGSSGERVRQMQARLIDLKLLDGTADGSYGSQTEEAVRLLQQRLWELGIPEIKTDGVMTPQLHALLMSDLSEHGFRAPIFFDETQPLSLTPQELYAKGCILIDAPSGEVLFEHEADTLMYPASTTKMMTLLLALESGQLEGTLTIGQSASDIPADSSRVPLYPGETMPVRDALYGLMIRSGNDAANAIAQWCNGSVEAFVERMNERAAELGMDSTHFVNPHGYHDEKHYTTARDLAILARHCLTDADFCRIATCTSYTMAPTQKRDQLLIQNTSEIFDPASEYYIPGAAGVKSGYTSHAGFCYVGAAQRNGHTLIAVILGVPGRTRGWTDLRRLFAYGFAAQ